MYKMRRVASTIIVACLLVILGLVAFNQKIVTHTTSQNEKMIDEIAEAREESIVKMKAEPSGYNAIETEPILQNPELPTGCESVALTMALESIGYNLEKTEIADEYLIYSVDNFVEGYMGDPYSEWGAGIFPPGLTATANTYLEAHPMTDTTSSSEQYTARDISGTAFPDLFPYVAAGSPVLIWITSDYESPMQSDICVEYDDMEYWWYMNEHCVMLGGYNWENENVLLYDPLQGLCEMPMETISNIYAEAGSYAVTIY